MLFFQKEKNSSENTGKEKDVVGKDEFIQEIKSGIPIKGYNPFGMKEQVKRGCDDKREKIRNNNDLTEKEKKKLTTYVDEDEAKFNRACSIQ